MPLNEDDMSKFKRWFKGVLKREKVTPFEGDPSQFQLGLAEVVAVNINVTCSSCARCSSYINVQSLTL